MEDTKLEKIGLCADIDDLVDAYESRMDRVKAQKILEAWYAKSNSDYVDQDWSETELSIDGKFTPDELEAIAWCKRNKIVVQQLASGEL